MPSGRIFLPLRVSIVCAGVAVLVGGCSTANSILEGKSIDYRSVGTLPTLEVPPDLTRPTGNDRFAVPGAGPRAATLSSYQTDRAVRQANSSDSAVLPRVENLRIERAGTQRWLVVPENADKLWPSIKEFWQENGFLVKIETPETGVMETDWAENRAKIPLDFLRSTLGGLIDQIYSTSERDKFRTRLERTADGKGTEIYVSHRGMEEVYASTGTTSSRTERTVWQPRKADPELEAEFLRRMMVRLGVQEERAKQVVANAASQEQRAQLKKVPNGPDSLEVYEPFDRAWRRIGLALDRIGFTVEDRDRQNGMYFVRYADPESDMERRDREKPGLLSRLQFWKTDDRKVKAEQYRVSVTSKQDTSQVQILAKEGETVGPQTASRILSLLHEQLK